MLRLFPAEQSGFCRQGPLRIHRLCILLAMLFTLFGLFPDVTDWELGGKKKKIYESDTHWNMPMEMSDFYFYFYFLSEQNQQSSMP